MCLATFDVKEPMVNFSCNIYDTQVAIVANKRRMENGNEPVIQVYDVGESLSCTYYNNLLCFLI